MNIKLIMRAAQLRRNRKCFHRHTNTHTRRLKYNLNKQNLPCSNIERNENINKIPLLIFNYAN